MNNIFEFEGKVPSVETQERVQRVFSDLCEYYKLKEQLPKTISLTKQQAYEMWGTTEQGGCRALYDKGKLYVVENDSEDAILAHEICHYLSDNSKYGGVYYQIEDIVVGRYLNEGITNYFSTQLFKYDKKYATYEYETHVAKLFSIIYGEDNLQDIFFNGDVTALRKDFNSHLEKIYGNYFLEDKNIDLTPFDVMACCLDTYTYVYSDAMTEAMQGKFDSSLKLLSLAEAQCVEEMLVFYAKEKGVKEAVEEEILAFLDTQIIPFEFNKLL